VDSSVVGYDGGRNVRDEERSVGRKKSNRDQTKETKQSRWGFRGMTVRNWLELLIVPLVLVGIGLLFEMQQANRQQAMEEQQQALEERRAEAERELAEQRAQDEALQAYLDQMSGLLLERDLRASEEDSEVRTLARARTLTVLERLDPSRKTAVMQFLVEADLVQRADGRDPIIGLSGADLSDADLINANLSAANLSAANLSAVELSGADLSDANLRDANLSVAHLIKTTLNGANLSDADLRDATLSGAVGLTDERIAAAVPLQGATMPNGQKYEDWLKDREKRQQDE
jgi:uncharacterized protein YjbI with pentapeptide repeats